MVRQATASRSHTRRDWFGVLFISLAVAMIIVDATIVNVAIPQIIRELDITATTAQWVQEVYTLVFAALLMTWGRLADRIGRRTVLLAGVLEFALASLLAALAPDGPLLVLGRVAQGLGGAMVLPTTVSLLNATFTGRARGIAFAVWGSTIGGTVALGPLLGGWLTTAFSWRLAFGVNLPLAAVILAGTVLTVRESREAATGRGLDLLGALLSALGFGALVFALIEGRRYGWWTPLREFAPAPWPSGVSPVPIAFGLAAVALCGFLALERCRLRAGRPVLLDLSLLSIRSFRNGSLSAMVVSFGEFGVLFALPLWLQNVLGYSAFRTGLALLPLAIGSFLASGLSVSLTGRISAPGSVRIGLAAETAGIVALGFVIAPDTPWWRIAPCLFVYGIGVGLATAQLTSVVLADVPVDRSGQASGTQSTVRQLGSALGIAVLGGILFIGLGTGLDHRLADAGLPPAQRDRTVAAVRDSAGAAIRGLAADPRTAPIATAARVSFSAATRYAALTGAAFLALGLLSTFRLTDRTRSGTSPMTGHRHTRADGHRARP